jgi:hypothetical protein
LTVLPTVKVIEMTFAEKCRDSCCGKGADKELPNGCQKEKCILNFNLNNATFLVFDTDYQLQKRIFKVAKKAKIYYQDNLTSNFSVAIWQPPEFSDIT